ncbi:MAG: hypothetical protein JSV83_06820 [Desulfobacterales bacterium]|nr:MAG: hypothetical protein JSV83_06820 [Desulfobacterales bacterium]
MARQNDEDSLSAELESRLDDLFGEDDKFSEGPVADEVSQDYPLGELKNLVLSIDWEITDEVLINFLHQINALKTSYKDDKINLTFLQILGSLGEYIKTNRGKAHPKTFKILNSVFSRFDDVVVSKDMQETEKKRILRAEMAKYKELRTQISRDKSDKIPKKAAKPKEKIKPQVKEQRLSVDAKLAPAIEKSAMAPKEELPGPEVSGVSYSEEIAKAVEEIKEFIHTEFKSLREALHLSQKQK